MASLPPNATVPEIEEELIYQQVLIDSLDEGANDYEVRFRELKAICDELENRLANAMNAPTRSTLPLQDMAHGSRNAYPTPPSVNTPVSAARINGGLQPNLANGYKRPRSDSISTPDVPYKRATPSPSALVTPSSSTSSLGLPQRSTEAISERFKVRQLAAEAAIGRRERQRRADEEFARSVEENWSAHPTSMAGPSSRPGVQTTLNRSGSFQRPPPPKTTLQSSSHSTFTPTSNHQHPYTYQLPDPLPVDNQHGQSSGQPPAKSEPVDFSQAIPTRPRAPAEYIDLTEDADDEASNSRRSLPGVSDVFPNHFALQEQNLREQHTLREQQMRQRQLQHHLQLQENHRLRQQLLAQHLPGSFPVSHPNQYFYGNTPTHHQTAEYSDWVTRTQAAGRMALNGMKSVANQFTDPFQQLSGLINGSSSRPFEIDDEDEDEADYESDSVVYSDANWRRRAPPYNMYDGHEDLYRSRYEMLESYNPEKTKDELNALLNNIRPDEELPDHLLVQTPEAMTIKLHKYQELGLTWLKNCEESSNNGGILADDMGLGKTIQMLSLMVTRRSEDPRCKTTLIVAPVALLRQWKQEIQQKIKTGVHALTVFIHHAGSKKSNFRDLQHYDVVLTTFGSLAAEVKKREKLQLRKLTDPNARSNKHEMCALIGEDCKWYRVILDEAQCIKNRNTKTAKGACMLQATYRFCMTGTPMMNNVDELYSLIKFLRIKPYDRWEKYRLDFTLPLKSQVDERRQKSMRMLQALCKAIMLRRTKKSTFQGQPILVLPERTTEVENAEFDDDERDLYDKLESRTQVTFNKYLSAGTVGRSYSAILVLLLRLRQACCHPHLITDFSIAAAADLTQEQLLDLARELSEQVVTRIKATGGNFECPVCMDACVNPAIFIPCGHDTCRDCFVKLTDSANALREGNEGPAKARCPHCRGDIDSKRITDFQSFKRVYMPELLTEEDRAQFCPIAEDNETDDSETESEDDERDGADLRGFIVNDDIEDSETESEAEEAPVKEEIEEAQAESSNSAKGKKSERKGKDKQKRQKKKKKKGKGKRKETSMPQMTLAELKKQANRSASARKKYISRLRSNYKDSAKIRKAVELLQQIMDDAEGEKVLIFSQWTSLLDLVEVEVDKRNWGYRRYDGSMNAKMRADAVDEFKDAPGTRIMLVSLKAGNAGLNLNVASQVIILDPFWNPYIEEQAIDRAHRIGQARPVKVHRVLVESTVEDRIIALQESKRKLIEQALDEQEASHLSRLGAQELAYLFGVTRSVNQPVNYREASRR